MKNTEVKYISLNEFTNNSGVKESTIKRRYKSIPGITKSKGRYIILSGTRYPFQMRGYKLTDSSKRRYILLKAISQYRFIDHIALHLERKQFTDMLRDLLSAGLIKENGLSNHYGANAYDCTQNGDALLIQSEQSGMRELAGLIAETTGKFTGSIISELNKAS